MRKSALFFVAICVPYGLFITCGSANTQPAEKPSTVISWPVGLPVYDHVVIVIEENKDYDQIIDNVKAPYINFTLREEGANFTQMFGEEHNSEGNYFWLFSGSNQTVGFKDEPPPAKSLSTPNLARSLIDKQLSFKGYAEDLPEIGSTIDAIKNATGDRIYARKHVPWISFSNVPNENTVATSSNLRFLDFPTDPAGFKALPTVAIVVPNQEHDMHNGKAAKSIPVGDSWLKKNLHAYY
jgi:acid phosphatase